MFYDIIRLQHSDPLRKTSICLG